MEGRRENINKQMANGNTNNILQGEFVFRKSWHDDKAKVVLGEKFPAGGGIGRGRARSGYADQHILQLRVLFRPSWRVGL